ncbi:FadR/GntR family transcriptional regulator [Nonomuraea sp. NPDC059194]|uniref:FadR/GntR family transcriptional regulator n=1 Tax=Nonomuraea sp. NPDC059194 TaxID=3346764 RepID=UPI003692F3F9
MNTGREGKMLAVIDSTSRGRGGMLRQQEVAELIKQYIVQNRLGPGDALPTEAELCAAIGASRSSVREAIKALTALDIVEVRYGHGTYVGRLSLAALVESLAFRGLLSRSDDFRVLSELIEVRQTIEQGLAGAIIAALDNSVRADLAKLVEQMGTRADAGESFIEQDREFHLLLMEPLGNQLLVQLTAAFWDVHAIVAPSMHASPESVRETVDAHRAIVDAIVAQDVAAFREAIAAHYNPVRKGLTLDP